MYTAQSLFYYPYGSFKDKQSPILRAAALYFDRLFILDPEKASAGVIGAEPILDDLDLLKKEGILVPVAPETVLGGLSGEISKAVQDDLKDEGFLQLCRRAGQASRWTIALSKLPDDKKLDEAVKSFMRDQARSAGTRKNANVPVYDETAMTALGRR